MNTAEMTTVEKVARAIALADLNASARSLPKVPMETMAKYVMQAVDDGHYTAMARAAIEALREPTTNMVLKGLVRSERDDIAITLEEVEEIWRAMIDDALNGKEG